MGSESASNFSDLVILPDFVNVFTECSHSVNLVSNSVILPDIINVFLEFQVRSVSASLFSKLVILISEFPGRSDSESLFSA